jgi:tetratricopeptide (TPR) repeat protein
MKNYILFYFAFVIFFVSSCTKHITVNVMHPAQIHILKDLQKVMVVDRTKYEKGGGKQVGKFFEVLLTRKPIGGDKYGRRGCMENLNFLLIQNERISFANAEVIEIKNSNTTFQNQKSLEANIIDSICEKYNADAIISLEYFNSFVPQRNLHHHPNDVNQTDRAYVTTKWRLYYPKESKILDEIEFQSFGLGYSRRFFDVPSNYRAIYNAGAQASDWYMKRIVPSMYIESRMYYTKGSKEMKMARKHAEVNNWNEAKFLWEAVVDQTSDSKLLGKASYNIALAYEQLGELEKALEWANKSSRTGNTKAPSYIRIIQTLINEKPLLEEQMKTE